MLSLDEDALIEALKRRIQADSETPHDHKRAAPFPPATEEQIESTERELDAPLPLLLRRIYLEVANGGFGPGFGILGANGGYRNDNFGTLVGIYRGSRDENEKEGWPEWPVGLLLLEDWGCTQLACLATAEFAGSIVLKDDNNGLTVTEFTLARYLAEWCEGRDPWKGMHEYVGDLHREGINPFTKQKQVIRKRVFRPVGTPWPGYPVKTFYQNEAAMERLRQQRDAGG
jgi:hypothetical protein